MRVSPGGEYVSSLAQSVVDQLADMVKLATDIEKLVATFNRADALSCMTASWVLDDAYAARHRARRALA